jgi:hypothetical protein
MSNINRRLDQLEAALTPPADRPIAHVFWSAEEGYWLTPTQDPSGPIDCLGSLDPDHPGNRRLDEAEFAALEKVFDVWLIRWVDMQFD